MMKTWKDALLSLKNKLKTSGKIILSATKASKILM